MRRLHVGLDGGRVGPPLDHHEAVLLRPLEQLVHPAARLYIDQGLDNLSKLDHKSII